MKYTILLFCEDWSPVCQIQEQIIGDLTQDIEVDINVKVLSPDCEEGIMKEKEVPAIPTTMVGNNESSNFEEKDTFVGITDKQKIKESIQDM